MKVLWPIPAGSDSPGPDTARSEPADIDADALAQHYPWPPTEGRTWVRACLLTTLDGAVAGPDGRSRSISGPADRAVLSAIRSWADAIVVGAGTLRTERYNPVRTRPGLAEQRVAAGRRPAARLVVVTRSAALDWTDPVFTQSVEPPLVVTCRAGGPVPPAVAVARLGVDQVDLVGLVDHLRGLGLGRITCEGGPSLLRDMLDAGTIDEVDLTIAPLLAGSAGLWPGVGAPRGVLGEGPLTGMVLAGLASQDDHLFARYLRRS